MLQALKRMLLSVTVALTTSITYGDYKHSSELSGFELAASKLGFTSPTQQEALLKIFYLAGYFEPQKLWHDLGSVDKNFNVTILKFQRNLEKLRKWLEPYQI